MSILFRLLYPNYPTKTPITPTPNQDKFDDLQRLEASCTELQQMFLYLAALVDEQGRQLETIETAVLNTKEYTGEAVVQLRQAKEYWIIL